MSLPAEDLLTLRCYLERELLTMKGARPSCITPWWAVFVAFWMEVSSAALLEEEGASRLWCAE